jgi:tRNA(fMet)-specific endonuclease VapC
MTPPEALLDTNIISLLIRRDTATASARQYRAAHSQFTISIITRFETLRGFKASGAAAKLAWFEKFCNLNKVLPLTDDIVVQASDIYADLYRRGSLIPDADILIAATALVNGLVMVTDNRKHFDRIPGLQIENWAR